MTMTGDLDIKSIKAPNPGRAGGSLKSTLGQIVLVFQGGGALGAYQVGVYQALHEAGIEPDWVIGTSIGAINAALIAGNPAEQRLEPAARILARVEHGDWLSRFRARRGSAHSLAKLDHGRVRPRRRSSSPIHSPSECARTARTRAGRLLFDRAADARP